MDQDVLEFHEFSRTMKKALIIAADSEVGSAFANWLALDEFETIVARDSVIGLKFAQERQPDLILCDVNMPDLDGFAILDELRLRGSGMKPFIVLIGHFDDSSRAFAAGADGFLFKSAGLSDLLRSIRAYADQIEQSGQSKPLVDSSRLKNNSKFSQSKFSQSKRNPSR